MISIMTHNFNSIQEALNYIFDGYNVDTINICDINGTPQPWFIADQIRLALDYKGGGNYDMLKYLSARDRWVKVYNISDGKIYNSEDYSLSSSESDVETLNVDTSKFPPSLINYINSKSSKARKFLLVSLPGVFELIFRSRSPKAKELSTWLCEIASPMLFNNPKLVH